MEYVCESVAHARVTRTILATYCPATSVLPFLPTHPPTARAGHRHVEDHRYQHGVQLGDAARRGRPVQRRRARGARSHQPRLRGQVRHHEILDPGRRLPSLERHANLPGRGKGGSCCFVCIKCKDLFIRVSSGQSDAVWLRVRRLESSHTPAATHPAPRAPRAAPTPSEAAD